MDFQSLDMLSVSDMALLASFVVAAKVDTFDEAGGFGYLITEKEERRVFFHCTQIADKSRNIEPGQRVCAQIVPGKSGDLEASHIVKVVL